MSSPKKKMNRAERQKLLFRIGAIILAALMLGGTLYSAFITLFFNAHAAYDGYAFDSNTSTVPYMTVGIIYGSDSPTAYEVKSPSGFVIGSVHATTEHRSFTPIMTLSQTALTPAVNANVAKRDGTYSVTNEYYQTKIGAYHIQLSINASQATVLDMLPQIDAAVKAAGHYAFPAYVNGVLCIRVGDFAAYTQTANSLNQIMPYLSGFEAEIVAPSETAVAIFDPSTDHVVFEYDSTDDAYCVGITPIQPETGEQNYLQTPANNLYEGVFAVRRYHTDRVDGITVFNVLDLEGYVEGVLPYEVVNSWPAEALRTFAIAIRSYALANIGYHNKAYGFDFCTTHCQAYRGRKSVTASILEAVSSTEGEVLSYDGKIVASYYSSTNGGESISLNAAWGGADSPYIVSLKTPWERYTEHSNGEWVEEVSPSALAAALRDRGHTTLTGDIASIAVNSYAGDDSGYVKSITITDVFGHSVTITNTDSVRTALSKYVNSANFVVGRGALQYVVNEVQSITVKDRVAGAVSSIQTSGDYAPHHYITSAPQSLLTGQLQTGLGTVEVPGETQFYVYTGNGIQPTGNDVYLLTGVSDGFAAQDGTTFSPLDPATGLVTAETIHGNTVITTVLKPTIKTYTASATGNFIFAGKGWGHGVGLSQYGTCDLAKAGAKAETILELYYPGTKIVARQTIGR